MIENGNFNVIIYSTCPPGDEGSVIELSAGNEILVAKVNEAYDPPLKGMENDRVDRKESYVKNFKPLKIGALELEKGYFELTLKALEIPGNSVMDLRLLMFERIK